MRLAAATLIAACAPCAGAQQPPGQPASAPARGAYEHHEATALERSAREHLRAGDRDTACILVDRAARISPHDRRIATGIWELEFAAVAASTPGAAESRPPRRAPAAMPAEPPALWPPR